MSEPFEIAGHVKWFDVGRGFGFVVPRNGLPDAFLHAARLRDDGFELAPPGASVLCEAVEVCGGLRVVRVLSVDTSTARPPRQSNSRVTVQPESSWERATVKWFNRVRGFGFLAPDSGGPDIFAHMEMLRCCYFTELRRAQVVEVRWGMGPKGRMAAELRPVR
jgi:CspA family cold shock protein